VSRSLVAAFEARRIDSTSVGTLRAIAAALDATFAIEIRWRGGALDRLLDERHAHVASAVIGILRATAWLTQPEVSYAHYAERGSIDILAWHPATRTLLVIEVKSQLVSVEETLRKLDEKVRLGPGVAAERFGWRPTATGRVLVLPGSSTNHRHVRAHEPVFEAALPARTDHVRGWLRSPRGSLAGILFVSDVTGADVKSGPATPHRVRPSRPRTNPSSTEVPPAPDAAIRRPRRG
jgi:hypothetical protein